MKRLLFSIVFVSCAVLSFGQYHNSYGDQSWDNTVYNTTEGTEFWVTFMSNSGASEGDMETMKLYLYATSRESTRVTIHNPNGYGSEYFDVQAGQQASFQVQNEWAYINTKEANTITNRGVRITSEKPISLYATNQHKSGKYDATNVLPTTALMGEYVIQTYRADVYATEFAIVATSYQDVTIKIKKTTIDQDKYNNGIIDTIGIPEEYTIYKQFYPGQTYLFRATEKLDGGNNFETSTSLSGTTICSDSPLAVFVGGQSAKISADPENHIFSQAYPTDKWGKSFYVTPTYGMVYDFVQFTACMNNTQIRKDGTLIATINAKESYIDTLKSVLQYIDDAADEPTYTPVPALYTTTNPTECYLYGTGYYINHPLKPNGKENTKEYTPYGAPVLTPIIPQELAMKSTMFATFTKTNTEMSHYVNIVTPTVEVSGMRLDNVNISTEFKPITGTDYSFLIKEISNTAHKIENIRNNSNSTFTARVYGLGASSSAKESYAYAVGSRVSRKTDILVNGQYIKEKSICITQPLTFEGLIEGDYTSVEWDFADSEGTPITDLKTTYTFKNSGDHDVQFIVKRPFPYICSGNGGANNYVEDRVSVMIHVNDKYYSDFSPKICEGETATLTGRDENGKIVTFTYNSPHQETKTLYTKEGCDSIVTINVQVGKPTTSETNVTECGSYTWHGQTYTTSGRYDYQYENEYGCTCTEYLNLTILQPVIGPTEKKTICSNSSYDWNGYHITKEGTYEAKLKAANGCDSIATLEVTVEDEYHEEISKKLCHGESYEWRGKILTEAKTYTETSSSPNGCISTFVLHLSFYPDYSDVQIKDTICAGTPYLFGDEILDKSGIYTKSFTSKGGCDSIVTLNLTVHPTYTKIIDDTICESALSTSPYIWKDSKGMELQQIKLSDLKNSGTWHAPDWTYITTYNHHSQYNCDSLLTLRLVVYPTINTKETLQLCPEQLPYKYCDNGATLPIGYTGGTKTETIPSKQFKHACDSIITYNIIVTSENIIPLTIRRCDNDLPYSYDYPNELPTASHTGKFTDINESGNYVDTVSVDGQCRTIYHLDFTVDKTYDKTLSRENVCVNQLPHRWHVNDKLNGSKIINITIPENAVLPFDTLCTDTLQSIHGCDSIVHLPLRVHPTYFESDIVYINDKESVHWIKNGKDTVVYGENCIDKPANIEGLAASTKPYFFPDSQITKIYGCDSVFHKYIYVRPTYAQESTDSICQYTHDNNYIWKEHETSTTLYDEHGVHISAIPTDKAGIFKYIDSLKTKSGADDSIWIMTLTVHPTYLYVRKADTTYIDICDNETYHFKTAEKDTVYNTIGDWVTGDYSVERHIILGMDTTVNGCDSAVAHVISVHPTYHLTEKDSTCQVYGGFYEWWNKGVLEEKISVNKGDTTIFAGKKYKTIKYGCDSLLGFELYVKPIYHFYDTLNICESDSVSWQGLWFSGNQFNAYHPDGYDASLYRRTQTNLSANTYHDTAWYHTRLNCDSIYHLTLYVHDVPHVTIERRYCQSPEDYWYECENRGAGGYLPSQRVGTYTYVDTIQTLLGCDSIVTLIFHVDSVYDYRQYVEVCQDTINTAWEWIDGNTGASHGYIDISEAGDFSYDDPYKTIYGCDSIYGIKIHVKPIYRFDSVYHVCENERLVWQNKQYTGYSVRDISLNDTIILPPGIYYEYRHYITTEGCDSDYYAQIHIHEIYDTLSQIIVCGDEDFVWYQNDHNGNYNLLVWKKTAEDTIRLHLDEVLDIQPAKDIQMRFADRMLESVNGCDSMTHLQLTILPGYFFYTDTTICANEHTLWRNRYIAMKDTVEATYTDSFKTIHGCDSIYQLHIRFKPTYIFNRYRELCDNETQYYPDDGVFPIWKPGDDIPHQGDHYDMVFQTAQGCDSIYRYFITIHPTYFFDVSTKSLCSNEQYSLHDHKIVSADTVFNVNYKIEPWDTIFVDTLSTIYGCDSVYWMKTRINPTYRYPIYDTICDNEPYLWRGHEYSFGGATHNYHVGVNDYHETYQTVEGCDSIYELHLFVHPTYLFVDSITKCADDDLTWHGQNLDHIAVGNSFYFDSLVSSHGCDSIYHLYLTVNDTTSETVYDTICRTEIYDFHGKSLMESGYYYDTTLNAWGCHHFTHLYLDVIEPTVPTAWADSICADYDAYDLYCTYTGRDPIAFSIYYDDEGHFYGFKDIEDSVILDVNELYPLRLPMPWRENDSTKYPKPNFYNIKLVLDNGICTNRDLCRTDTSIVLSYPSWITQQRFGDVIALFNEKYNGGYYWDKFQWYHGDTLLIGETHEYLYIPTGLIVGDQYHVRLTRVGETQDFQTCPITIVPDPIIPDFSPQMGYLSVVPTCIFKGHPIAYILSRKGGTFRIYSGGNGMLIKEGHFHADVTEVELPAQIGLYIFELSSPGTPEEPYRSIKVLVSDQCENCNMPF